MQRYKGKHIFSRHDALIQRTSGYTVASFCDHSISRNMAHKDSDSSARLEQFQLDHQGEQLLAFRRPIVQGCFHGGVVSEEIDTAVVQSSGSGFFI